MSPLRVEIPGALPAAAGVTLMLCVCWRNSSLSSTCFARLRADDAVHRMFLPISPVLLQNVTSPTKLLPPRPRPPLRSPWSAVAPCPGGGGGRSLQSGRGRGCCGGCGAGGSVHAQQPGQTGSRGDTGSRVLLGDARRSTAQLIPPRVAAGARAGAEPIWTVEQHSPRQADGAG